METKILFKNNAQEALYQGVKELADAVSATLGPKGHCVMIDKGYGIPHITKDGVTVARAYDTDNCIKRMGAVLVKTVAAKTCDQAGDGTTTATILTHSLIKNGMTLMAEVENPQEFRKGMEEGRDYAVDFIKKHSIKIESSDYDRLYQIAKISANGDDEIATIIVEAIKSVGNDGVITVEEASSKSETSIDVTTGFQWDKGLTSPYFVTDPERLECVLDKPYVLIWGQTINYPQEILSIVQSVYTDKRSLLIVAPNASTDVMNFLVTNVKQNSGLKAAFVKAPGYGQIQKDMLEDLAIKMGGKVVSDEFGNSPSALGTDWLGECSRCVITSNKTMIIGGAGTAENISNRIKTIKNQLDDNENQYDREKFRERISKLNGGAATIYIGADSEVEMKERKDRVDDAVAAVRAALDEGFVPGGGTIQFRTYLSMILEKGVDEEMIKTLTDRERGFCVVASALKSFCQRLCENNCCNETDYETVLSGCSEEEFNIGYNPIEEEFCDMIEAGIIDPAKVTRVALENSVSVAIQFLNTSCVISTETK